MKRSLRRPKEKPPRGGLSHINPVSRAVFFDLTAKRSGFRRALRPSKRGRSNRHRLDRVSGLQQPERARVNRGRGTNARVSDRSRINARCSFRHWGIKARHRRHHGMVGQTTEWPKSTQSYAAAPVPSEPGSRLALSAWRPPRRSGGGESRPQPRSGGAQRARLDGPPPVWLRVSRDREHGFRCIVSKYFAGL